MRASRLTGWMTAIVLFALGSACSRPAPHEPAYIPGLGEIMTLNQMRHSKLWFAAQAGNWSLASYELDELQEGLDDAARYHPAHKGSPLPIPALIQKIMALPMSDLRGAIRSRDLAAFTSRFDALTAGCNSCHQAANFGFNVVQRPLGNPFTNESFLPGPDSPDAKPAAR